ncbi:hypothetical protein BJ322DRAFT_981451, partial [Thelephora terrestris]
QRAVYCDRGGPTFWCSIIPIRFLTLLYFWVLFRDALDAYSRAIRINPYISEVWVHLGVLHKSCNNQISNATE